MNGVYSNDKLRNNKKMFLSRIELVLRLKFEVI